MGKGMNPQYGQKYSRSFDSDKLPQIRSGPVQDRSCRDKLCLILFILMLGIFVGLTVYFLIQGSDNFKGLTLKNQVKSNTNDLGSVFSRIIPQIIGMLALSIVMAIIFVVLSVKFPKCLVYTAIIVTFLVYIAMIVLGILFQVYALSIVFGIILLINACVLYCCRHQIKVGIVLLKVTGLFVQQKPQIIVVGFLSLLLNVIFVALFILGYIAGFSNTIEDNNPDENSRKVYNGLLIPYNIATIFFGYFLYYLMVFVVATAVAYWYYQQQKSVLYGYKPVGKHIGSLTFASAVITLITMARQAAQQQANGDGALGIVCCILACLIGCIQHLVQVLNHNAVIVMAVTSEGYVHAAKSAIGIIFNNYALFVIVDFITGFMQFYGLIMCVLLPALIGGLLIQADQKNGTSAVIGGVVIFLLGWIISSVVMGIMYEVMSSVYIFYCFDRKFRAQGINAGNIPPDIRDLLDGADGRGMQPYNGGRAQQPPTQQQMMPMQQPNYPNNNRGNGFQGPQYAKSPYGGY